MNMNISIIKKTYKKLLKQQQLRDYRQKTGGIEKKKVWKH